MKRIPFYRIRMIGTGLLFCVLLLCGLVYAFAGFAQPQAPVEWGEAQWFDFVSQQNRTESNRMALMGDSIVVVDDNPSSHVATAFSFDNGQTFSDWTTIIDHPCNCEVSLTGSMGRVLAVIAEANGTGYLDCTVRLSTDAGQSWSPPGEFIHNGGYHYGILSGDRALRIAGPLWPDDYAAFYSSDGALNWSEPSPIPGSFDYDIYPGQLGLTRDHAIVAGNRRDYPNTDIIYSSSGSGFGEQWSDFTQIMTNAPEDNGLLYYSIAADTSSENGVIVGFWMASLLSWLRGWIYQTQDGGQSWQEVGPLTDSATVSITTNPQVFCRGKLFGVAWQDIRQPPGSLWWRFSANHGKNWYPDQQLS